MDQPTQGTTQNMGIQNFKLSSLFTDFNCDNINDFVFDDVQLTYNSDSVSFSGKLRMTGILATFKNYLNATDSLLVTATIAGKVTGPNSKLKPSETTLKCSETFFKQVISGVTLTKTFFELDITQSDGAWHISPQLKGDFDVDGLSDNDTGAFSLLVKEANKTLDLVATAQHLSGAFGIHSLNLENVKITGELSSDTKSLDLTSDFTVGAETFNFAGEITSNAVGITASVNTFDLTDLSNLFNDLYPTGITLPNFDVDFKNSSLSFATTDMEVDQKSIPKGLSLATEITVHGYSIETTAQISSSGVIFDGVPAALSFGPIDIKKSDINFQIFKKSLQKPAKFEISGEAVIEGLTLDCFVYFEKETTYTTVLYASIDASSFRFAHIFPAAQGTFVNELTFSKLTFIYASAKCTTQSEGVSYKVTEGVQLMGILEEIPGLSDLTGEKHIGLLLTAHFGTVTDIGIAIPDTRLNLGHGVVCDPLTIQINIEPVPSLEVIFGMDVSVPKQSTPLHFDMSLSLSAVEAKGAVTMKNYWKNPFGIHGIKIGPALAVQIDIIYEQFVSTGLPSGFAVAGGLVIGDTTVDMAVSISENPMEEILMGKLEELNPTQLIDFAAQIVDLSIPNIPNFFELKELELYCAPDGGSIGTIVYKPGFSFSGNIVIGGKDIAMYTRVSDSGIEGAGHIDQLHLGPLHIGGLKGKNATVDLELTTEKQSLEIDGSISFLGLEEGLYVNISNKGIAFKFEQDFWKLLQYEIQGASAGDINHPESLSFELSGTMDNKINSFLKNAVTSKINAAIHATTKSIDEAEHKVDEAKAAYEAVYNKADKALTEAQAKADAELKKLTGALSDAKSAYASKLSAAQQKVSDAKAAYDKALGAAQNAVTKAQKTYDDGIKAAQNKVNSTERTYNNGIKAAQNKVNSAEKKYNDSIGSALSAVKSLERKAHSLDHWYSKPAYWAAEAALKVAEGALDAVKYGADYTAFQAAKTALSAAKTGVDYTAFEAAKAALVVAKTGANYAAFKSAKLALQGVKDGTDYTVWQGTLKTLSAVETAGKAAISTASKALNDIGKTAAYVALAAAKAALKAVEKGTEAATFDAAKTALEAAKTGAEGVLMLADYIAHHAGDLIDIKSFTFKGDFSAIQGGASFDATLDLVLLKHEFNWTIDFDTKKVTDFIDALFKKAFHQLKEIAGF